eukprot:COSAG01_NODE_1865_length_9036_cov_6.511022_10_plen_52_part_00
MDAEMQALAARVGSVEAEAATVGREALERCGPIDAPCTHCLRHGDPMHAQK